MGLMSINHKHLLRTRKSYSKTRRRRKTEFCKSKDDNIINVCTVNLMRA